MKKQLLIITLATVALFADETHLPLPTLESKDTATSVNTTATVILDTPTNESENFNRRFIPYVKLGPDLLNVGHSNHFSPNIGVGIRSESYDDAVDFSISYSSRLENKEGEERGEYQMFCPKILYHRYLNPGSPSSFFYGAGGSWGSMQSEMANKSFTGLYGDLSVGYETGRDTMIRQIVQCNLAQPVLAFSQKGTLPTPSLELSYSLGF